MDLLLRRFRRHGIAPSMTGDACVASIHTSSGVYQNFLKQTRIIPGVSTIVRLGQYL